MPCAKEGCHMRNGKNTFCIHHRPDNEFPECSICLKSIRRTKDMLTCKHAFHKRCIDYWYEKSNSCPMCRTPIVPDETRTEEPWINVLHDQLLRAMADLNAGAQNVEVNISFNALGS